MMNISEWKSLSCLSVGINGLGSNVDHGLIPPAPLPTSPRWGEEQKTPSPSGGGPGWGSWSMVKTMFKAKWTELEPIPN